MKKDRLIGQRFGLLEVIEERPVTKAGHSTWLCKCDCGNEVIRTSTSIKRSKHSSCGCYSIFGKNNPLWDGVGDISAGWFYDHVQRSANGDKAKSRRKKEINIDIKYIWDLFLEQDRKCALSGIGLFFPKKSTTFENKLSTASLDRIESSKGYVKGNVQWVHKNINIMKNVFDEDVFIYMCKEVAKSFKNK